MRNKSEIYVSNRKSEAYISPYTAYNRNMLMDRKMTVQSQPFENVVTG